MDYGTATELASQAIDDSNDSLQLFSLSLRESKVVLCSLGASIQSWRHNDNFDIVLGYKDAMSMYQSKNPVFFSSIVGRVANRIAKGKLSLGGAIHELEINNPPNHLHGGGLSGGFSHKIWNGSIVSVRGGQGVQFSLTSEDGDQGFPGKVQVTATYSLRPSLSSSGVVLRLEMEAQLIGDKPSPINLAQHSYFNLSGHLSSQDDDGGGTLNGILDHTLRLHADSYTPVDETAIPTRKVQTLNDDPVMDWRKERNIRQALHQYGVEKMGLSADATENDLNSREPSIGPYGFDHNYVVRKQPGASIPKVAELSYQDRKLTVYSTAPGVQLYTANYLSSSENASICKTDYQAWSAVCLETQHFPDSIIESEKEEEVDSAFVAGKCPILTPQSPNYNQCIDYCLETDAKAAEETSGSDTLTQKYASVEDMWQAQDLSTWYKRAKDYYEDNCAATIEGVLGGIGWISDTDLNGSREFLKGIPLPKTEGPSVACECGAGIGRVTKGLLLDFCDRSDLVESSERLLFASPEYIGNDAYKCRFFAKELQDWEPPEKKYSIVWIQWVLCYLTDDDIVKFLQRCSESLVDGGIIVMKENTCADPAFVVDVDDASATRSIPYWLDLIFKAGLKVTKHQMQDDFPDDIYPVPMFALQPVSQQS